MPRRTAAETKILKEQRVATRWKINYIESNAPLQNVEGKPGKYEIRSDVREQLEALYKEERLLDEILAPKKRAR